MAEVVLADPDAQGLDAMIAALLTSAIADPVKARILDAMRGAVQITVPDAEVTIGLYFAGGVCRVANGRVPHPTISLTAPSDVMLAMSTVPLTFGLPAVNTVEGREFLGKVFRREIRISGMQHVFLLSQLNRLMSLPPPAA